MGRCAPRAIVATGSRCSTQAKIWSQLTNCLTMTIRTFIVGTANIRIFELSSLLSLCTMSDENQHWVPKFLIKYFADKDGRVFCFDINTHEVTKPPPRLAASEEGFNDFHVDGESVSFEDKLEKIETAAAPLIRRIVEKRTLAGQTPEGRRRIAEFMAAQSFRTKAFYEGLPDKPNRQEFGSTFGQLWESIFITASEISRRYWALMVIASDDCFYLGDNPIVLQRTDNPKDGSGLGFDVEGVEAFMPLSPKCALFMPCRTTGDDRIARYDAALELHRVVRSAVLRGLPGGSTELQLAQLVIGKLHELVRAFRTGAPIIASVQSIENFNYLQCSWSHAAIYSNRGDFVFARRVFRENPQYRSVPRTSLIRKNVLVPDLPASLRQIASSKRSPDGARRAG